MGVYRFRKNSRAFSGDTLLFYRRSDLSGVGWTMIFDFILFSIAVTVLSERLSCL